MHTGAADAQEKMPAPMQYYMVMDPIEAQRRLAKQVLEGGLVALAKNICHHLAVEMMVWCL